ncbi:MAG: hypothetical protein H0U00_12530, partial [Actinobacteria bacterium]|nr:hypothetical protein [Actinomycetota bacterium]
MRARHIGMVVGALGLGLALVLLRGEPRWNSDQGVFLSIAARLLDGDRLYSDVIDNKEPLFFYTYAGALWVGGWRGPAALDGVWFALAAVSSALLLRELKAPTSAVVAGFFIYPLVLTASWYEPGLSMLGGLAIAPLAAWLWLRGQFAASGAALGIALSFKLSLAFVATAPMVAFVLIGAPTGSRAWHVGKAALGLLATLGAVALVLAVRGELGKYVEIIAFNIQYPDGAQRAMGGSPSLASHFDIVRAFFVASGKWQAPAAMLVVGVFVVAVLFGLARSGRAFLPLAGATTATLIAALG